MHVFDHVGMDPIEMTTETIDGKRYYVTPSGGKYPSITTVISNNSKKQAGLARWRNRVGKRKHKQYLIVLQVEALVITNWWKTTSTMSWTPRSIRTCLCLG